MLVVTRYGESLKRRFIREIADVKELPDAPSEETGWLGMANRVARRDKPVIKPFDFSTSVCTITSYFLASANLIARLEI
jgi:hypothetical protein